MATAAPRSCEWGWCPVVGLPAECERDDCPGTRRQRLDRERGSATERGYGARWQRESAAYLEEHPNCELCGEPATVVDHIRPHRGDPVLFWDHSNWQALSVTCHNRKTATHDTPRDGAGRFARSPRSRR